MSRPSPRTFPRKPIFDAVRTMLRRGFRQSEVERLDMAIENAIDRKRPVASVPRVPRNDALRCVSPRRVSEEGIALIKRFEGCASLRSDGLVEAYPDPASGGDPWTIGWGATGEGLEPGTRIGPGTIWTKAQCDARLASDLVRYAGDVARVLGGAPTTQAQFDALVSFHYNTGAIARATLTRLHVAGDTQRAAAEFARWNKAGGRVIKGLVRRRAAEARLYLS